MIRMGIQVLGTPVGHRAGQEVACQSVPIVPFSSVCDEESAPWCVSLPLAECPDAGVGLCVSFVAQVGAG